MWRGNMRSFVGHNTVWDASLKVCFIFFTNLKKQQVAILPKDSLMIIISDRHIYWIKHNKQENKKQATKDRKRLK